MKDDRLSKTALFGHPSRDKRKAGSPQIKLEEVRWKDLNEIITSWDVVKRNACNRLGRRMR